MAHPADQRDADPGRIYPYDASRSWTEDDVLAWLRTNYREIIDDPGWAINHEIVDMALTKKHDQVFWWYFSVGWASWRYAASNLYSLALSHQRFDLADDLFGRGVSLGDFIDDQDSEDARTVAWLVMHTDEKVLAKIKHQTWNERILVEGGQYPALRRLLAHYPGRKMAAINWERLERYVLFPRLSESQQEWVPARWPERAAARRREVRAALMAILPTNLANYVNGHL